MIKWKCQHCSVALKAKEGAAGREVTCPKCSQRVQIPDPSITQEEQQQAVEENPFAGFHEELMEDLPRQIAEKYQGGWVDEYFKENNDASVHCYKCKGFRFLGVCEGCATFCCVEHGSVYKDVIIKKGWFNKEKKDLMLMCKVCAGKAGL